MSAELGNVNAQNAQGNLGFAYENGRGVPKDYAEAARWYRRVADQGVSWAQTRLGEMYEYGHVGPVDYVEATRWYRQAASEGDVFAQTNLGLLYERGLGVARVDRAEAA